MYCDLWPYVLWPLDFQIQKRIISVETMWVNSVLVWRKFQNSSLIPNVGSSRLKFFCPSLNTWRRVIVKYVPSCHKPISTNNNFIPLFWMRFQILSDCGATLLVVKDLVCKLFHFGKNQKYILDISEQDFEFLPNVGPYI